jgi:Putative beta-barrel porin-2, OmpL-like. bbp2
LYKYSFVLALFLFHLLAFAQDELPVKFGGFVDTYYANDFNNPKDHEREFTTQPVRHNEFNVNLAYIEAVLKQEKTRGRLALQFGNSVIKNTVGEPRLGATSGPEDAKFIQEAYVGKKIGERTWIDGGIFLGNIGAESWISKDNWTYSRALNLDYVPYYSAGVRIEHLIDESQSMQLQILNGWQNMSENNNAKAIGMQYKKLLSESLTFTYNNFFGDEKVVPNLQNAKFNSRFRGYHNFVLQWLASDRWNFLGSMDFGHQSQQANKGIDAWGAGTLTVRRILNSKESIAFRVEYYNDRHQANIVTITNNGFQVVGASLNYDQRLDENAIWRTELRGFSSKDEIYPQGSKYRNRLNGFIATSLSLWF